MNKILSQFIVSSIFAAIYLCVAGVLSVEVIPWCGLASMMLMFALAIFDFTVMWPRIRNFKNYIEDKVKNEQMRNSLVYELDHVSKLFSYKYFYLSIMFFASIFIAGIVYPFIIVFEIIQAIASLVNLRSLNRLSREVHEKVEEELKIKNF